VIGVERFAQLQAAIEFLAEPRGILADDGLGEDEWRHTVSFYLAAFESQMRAGRSELGVRYLAAYFAAIDAYRSPAAPVRPASAETAEVDVNQAREGMRARGIPFRPPTDNPPSPSNVPVAVAMARPAVDGSPDLAPSPAGDDEPSPDTIATERAAPRSLPFEHAGDLMKLDRYAEMAAELRVRPADASAIMACFGLDTHEQRERIHTLWRRRFEANPALFATFTEAVEQKSAVLQSKPPNDE